VLAIACCVSVAVGALLSVMAPQMMEIFNSITTPMP
jgi:hypothetical protein